MLDAEQVELDLLHSRLDELHAALEMEGSEGQEVLTSTIHLIKEHIRNANEETPGLPKRSSFVATGDDWTFDHVYQVHFPRISVDPAIRDVSYGNQIYRCD